MQSPRDGKMRTSKTLRLCAECMAVLPKHLKDCPQKDSDSPRAILRQREGVYSRTKKVSESAPAEKTYR
jgi:hypothetical protein